MLSLEITIPSFSFDMQEIEESKFVIVYNTNDKQEIEGINEEIKFLIPTIKFFSDDKLKFLDSLDDKDYLPPLIKFTRGEKYYLFKIDACSDFLKEVKKAQDGVKNFITSRDKKKKEKKNLYYKAKSRLIKFSITIYNILYDLKREERREYINRSDEYEDEADEEDLSYVKTSIEDIEKIFTKFIPELNEFKFIEGSLRVFMENIFFNSSNDYDEYFITTYNTTNNTPIDRTSSSCSKDSKKEEKEFTKQTSDEIKEEEKEFTKHTSYEYDFNPELDAELFNKLVETSDPIYVSDGRFQNDLHKK